MFCYQCEQTAKGTGCDVLGACGKKPEVADLQDLLLYTLMGLSQVVLEGIRSGIEDRRYGVFTAKAVVSTLTNVDFDPQRFVDLIHQSVALREDLKKKLENGNFSLQRKEGAATFQPAETQDELLGQAARVGLFSYPADNPDILSLKHTLLFGIKGVAAYADHAQILGHVDDELYHFIFKGLAAIQQTGLNLDDGVRVILDCGKAAYRAMELLDAGNTETYGHPIPTKVPLGHKKGKAILVSGHDLKDLEQLLKQTRGKGIFVYTHGEMLSLHGYPKLKEYNHFYGHFGTAWQNQAKEFPDFPGAILMTTNCLQRPQKSYEKNLFTSGMVGWPGIPHVQKTDFQPVIDRALALPGFDADADKGTVMVGFARNAILDKADDIIAAVKAGRIRHFFLVAGCDGAKPGRNYYTEFVEKVPEDCMVMTLACGKYRFFDKDLGNIDGIPRLLDVGQCNDAYSAIQMVLALSRALDTNVNDLPLSMILSWYEQKAVCILLALL
ncbi:MAG: hydroxylamine reductase, partial [Desulfotignum sp.]|nr:hydroxylamine reductase [Desulfotignum sp.]